MRRGVVVIALAIVAGLVGAIVALALTSDREPRLRATAYVVLASSIPNEELDTARERLITNLSESELDELTAAARATSMSLEIPPDDGRIHVIAEAVEAGAAITAANRVAQELADRANGQRRTPIATEIEQTEAAHRELLAEIGTRKRAILDAIGDEAAATAAVQSAYDEGRPPPLGTPEAAHEIVRALAAERDPIADEANWLRSEVLRLEIEQARIEPVYVIAASEASDANIPERQWAVLGFVLTFLTLLGLAATVLGPRDTT